MKAGFVTRRLWVGISLGLLVIVTVLLAVGCGDKLALPSDLPKPDPNGGGIDTAYVLVNPIWTGANGIAFNQPHDVVIGYDQYIYVCDTKNNRVIKLAEDGTFIESDSVVNPVAVTQDRGLDLLVVSGDYKVIYDDTIHVSTDSIRVVKDTTVYGNSIRRKKHFGGQGFQVVWEADSPYFSRDVHGTTVWEEAQFWGIAASLETSKEYYLADFWYGKIYRFNSEDQNRPPELVGPGTGNGVTTFPMDLYYYTISGQSYLAFAQASANNQVQVVSPVNGAPLFTNTGEGLPEMVRLNLQTVGSMQVAVDEQSNFYVLAARNETEKTPRHLFFKYNRKGEKLLSFGSQGSGERQFNRPRGLAYLNGVVYIADTGNNRIVRYQLATDIQQ